MSAIMRPRRSLIGLSLIEGSCPELEFGTLNPQDGTPAPSSPVDQLARSSPLAPLRAQRTPARAGSFFDPQPTCVAQDFCSANCPLNATLPRRRSCQTERQ